MAEGKNVYFERNILDGFKALRTVYSFKDFCKMAVREEIERRIRDVEGAA